ncbi:glutathione S-transferase PHI 10 [Striga asiatica]|uniref:Glutathione S-transferase PHI 10 n=1 Tax=Striga asiatica TaxID=4170 RepID=A0A5A7R5R3_STRAF|nr:glutathione S-transferase PHI 10 [Striga asiatica]
MNTHIFKYVPWYQCEATAYHAFLKFLIAEKGDLPLTAFEGKMCQKGIKESFKDLKDLCEFFNGALSGPVRSGPAIITAYTVYPYFFTKSNFCSTSLTLRPMFNPRRQAAYIPIAVRPETYLKKTMASLEESYSKNCRRQLGFQNLCFQEYELQIKQQTLPRNIEQQKIEENAKENLSRQRLITHEKPFFRKHCFMAAAFSDSSGSFPSGSGTLSGRRRSSDLHTQRQPRPHPQLSNPPRILSIPNRKRLDYLNLLLKLENPHTSPCRKVKITWSYCFHLSFRFSKYLIPEQALTTKE